MNPEFDFVAGLLEFVHEVVDAGHGMSSVLP